MKNINENYLYSKQLSSADRRGSIYNKWIKCLKVHLFYGLGLYSMLENTTGQM